VSRLLFSDPFPVKPRGGVLTTVLQSTVLSILHLMSECTARAGEADLHLSHCSASMSPAPCSGLSVAIISPTTRFTHLMMRTHVGTRGIAEPGIVSRRARASRIDSTGSAACTAAGTIGMGTAKMAVASQERARGGLGKMEGGGKVENVLVRRPQIP